MPGAVSETGRYNARNRLRYAFLILPSSNPVDSGWLAVRTRLHDERGLRAGLSSLGLEAR